MVRRGFSEEPSWDAPGESILSGRSEVGSLVRDGRRPLWSQEVKGAGCQSSGSGRAGSADSVGS